MSGDKPHLNGRDTAEGNAKESEDVEMEEGTDPGQAKGIKRKDGDEEMTVVVPPTKSSKTPGAPQKDIQGDVAMNGDTEADDGAVDEAVVDPREKVIISKFCPCESPSLQPILTSACSYQGELPSAREGCQSVRPSVHTQSP